MRYSHQELFSPILEEGWYFNKRKWHYGKKIIDKQDFPYAKGLCGDKSINFFGFFKKPKLSNLRVTLVGKSRKYIADEQCEECLIRKMRPELKSTKRSLAMYK